MDEEKVLPQEEEPKKTWKEKIYSQEFMRWVNILFILIVILQRPVVTVVGCGLWLVYLAVGFALTKTVALRIAYGILALVALGGIVIGIIAL